MTRMEASRYADGQLRHGRYQRTSRAPRHTFIATSFACAARPEACEAGGLASVLRALAHPEEFELAEVAGELFIRPVRAGHGEPAC